MAKCDQNMDVLSAVLEELDVHRRCGNTSLTAAAALLATRLGLQGAAVVVANASHTKMVHELFLKAQEALGLGVPQAYPRVIPLDRVRGGSLRGYNRKLALLFDGDAVRSLLQTAYNDLADANATIRRQERALTAAQYEHDMVVRRVDDLGKELARLQLVSADLVSHLGHDPQSDSTRDAYEQLRSIVHAKVRHEEGMPEFKYQVEDTTDTASNPAKSAAFLLHGLMMGGSSAIVHQEATGIAQLLESDALPVQGAFEEYRTQLEGLGFVFGNVIKADPLFVEAKLPPGWSKSDANGMSFSVRDAQGRKRLQVFYKAAFYDRKAQVNVHPRWIVNHVQDDAPESTESTYRLLDTATGQDVMVGQYDDCIRKLKELQLGDYFEDWAAAPAP